MYKTKHKRFKLCPIYLYYSTHHHWFCQQSLDGVWLPGLQELVQLLINSMCKNLLNLLTTGAKCSILPEVLRCVLN